MALFFGEPPEPQFKLILICRSRCQNAAGMVRRGTSEGRLERAVKVAATRPMSFVLTVPIVVVPTQSNGASPIDEVELLALHSDALKSNVEGDLDLLLATQTAGFILRNSAEIPTPTRKDRHRFLSRYLRTTKFTAYRDRYAPIVRTTPDRMLGWVASEIEAWGVAQTSHGKRRVEFVMAWIELYERRDGRWAAVRALPQFTLESRGMPLQRRPRAQSAQPGVRKQVDGH